MSIRAKIFIACLCLAAVGVGDGLLARNAQLRLGSLAVQLYDDAFLSMSYLRSAQNALASLSSNAVLGGAGSAALLGRVSAVQDDLGVARARAMSPEGGAAIDRLLADVAQLAAELERTGAPGQAQDLQRIEDTFDIAVEIFAGDAYRVRRATSALAETLSRQAWIAMGASLAVAFAITAWLSWSIVPSVRHAVGIATAIAAGRLDNTISPGGTSETGTLLRALSAMQTSIADKIAQIERLLVTQASSHASEIASQHARFEMALDNMVQGLCMFGADDRLLVHNRRFAELFGVPGSEARAAQALPPSLRYDRQADGGPDRITRVATHSLDDGRVIAVVEKPMAGGTWLATYEDVTERHQVEARMAHMARHDSLTGLANRVLFSERLEQALAQVRRGGGLAVLCLDLDRFKSVNDTFGAFVGDALLQAIARRILDSTRETDLVVRLGGDEFAVIQSTATQPTDAKRLAERLVEVIAAPLDIQGHSVAIQTSIGIAVNTDGLVSVSGMLKHAELALHRAKMDGRGVFRFFESEMDARMQARRLLELDLRRAVANEEFEVFYQPLITTETGAISGFEALVRWRHPTRGLVSPAEFIPVAEELGLIAAIGNYVLRQACIDAKRWPDDIKVSVNLSPIQFGNLRFADEVIAALRGAALAPERLELEITESLLLQDSAPVLGILHEIRSLGVRLSMDDFGTGYSSLSYLRRFPFDKIKIDQSFIRNLAAQGDCIAIVRAIIGLGRSLGMSIVAEGVETAEQYELLRHEGCQQLQGYLFSKPQPIELVGGLIDRHRARSVA